MLYFDKCCINEVIFFCLFFKTHILSAEVLTLFSKLSKWLKFYLSTKSDGVRLNTAQTAKHQGNNLMFFSTVHHSIELFHQPTLMHSFLYSLTICLLPYYPRNVSSINMPIFRRKNCIHTASDIFALCKCLHSTLVESGPNQCTVQTFTESEYTRCCVNTIFPPEDGHVNARNMSRIIV